MGKRAVAFFMIRFVAALRHLFRSVPPHRHTSAEHDKVASAGGKDVDVADEETDVNNPFPAIVAIEIRDSLDLHTISPRDIPAVVREYLHEARARGWKSVRIIHGKGTGTQRAVVRRILAETNFVRDFMDAPPFAGGWGATVAQLAPDEQTDLERQTY